MSDSEPIVVMNYYQARVQTTSRWSINSLDIVLGLVGGLAGLVWGTLSLVFGSYEAYRLQNSLIGSIYPMVPRFDRESRGGHHSEKQAMMRTVI